MKVFEGGKEVSLGNKEYISKGGEGSIYGKGQTIYKIYHEPKKMIPEAKIDQLQALQRDNILYPKKVLKTSSGTPIGFTMTWVKNTEALCKLFTNGFRDIQGYTTDDSVELVDNIRQTIEFIHSKECLMVDGNEFNYLVDTKTYKSPYFIDVDSYQTKSFPPTAIMPSIRDWNCGQDFTVLSDWFSFGIIACQLFVGIHPFKGRHPKYSRKDMEQRMREGISVFNKDTRVPAATRSFDNIPSLYKDWFLTIFESKRRIPPPDVFGVIDIKVVIPDILQSTDKLGFQMIWDLGQNEKFLYFGSVEGVRIAKSTENVYIGKRVILRKNESFSGNKDASMLKSEVILSKHSGIPVLVTLANRRLKAIAEKKEVSCPDIEASDMMIVNNTLYLIYNGNLTEMALDEIGKGVIISVSSVWAISPNSSKVFRNVIYEDLLGTAHLTIPLPGEYNHSQLHTVRVSELDGYKIIDAKHEMQVASVVGYKDGQYDRLTLIFNPDYSDYRILVTEDVDDLLVNFIVLPNGVTIESYQGKISLYMNRIESTKVKEVQDDRLDSSFRLCSDGVKVRVFKDNRLYSLEMRR